MHTLKTLHSNSKSSCSDCPLPCMYLALESGTFDSIGLRHKLRQETVRPLRPISFLGTRVSAGTKHLLFMSFKVHWMLKAVAQTHHGASFLQLCDELQTS